MAPFLFREIPIPLPLNSQTMEVPKKKATLKTAVNKKAQPKKKAVPRKKIEVKDEEDEDLFWGVSDIPDNSDKKSPSLSGLLGDFKQRPVEVRDREKRIFEVGYSKGYDDAMLTYGLCVVAGVLFGLAIRALRNSRSVHDKQGNNYELRFVGVPYDGSGRPAFEV